MTTLRDPGSGLLNAAYFDVAVPERVAVARRSLRPLSLVLLRSDVATLSIRERAAVVRGCLRDADTACQLDGGVLGIILEDTPVDGAIWTAERLRRDLQRATRRADVWVGIATYPAHTLDAVALLAAAHEALASAASFPGSRIEVAPQA